MVSIVLLRIREISDVKQETRGECADQQHHRQLIRYSVYPFQCRLQCFAKYLDTSSKKQAIFQLLSGKISSPTLHDYHTPWCCQSSIESTRGFSYWRPRYLLPLLTVQSPISHSFTDRTNQRSFTTSCSSFEWCPTIHRSNLHRGFFAELFKQRLW